MEAIQFKDQGGRAWTLPQMNGRLVHDVLDTTGCHLGQLLDAEHTNKLADPFVIIQIVYILCEKQIKNDGITVDNLVEQFDPDTIEAASAAIWRAAANFTPTAQRKILNKIIPKTLAKHAQAQARAVEALDDPETEAEIDRMIDEFYAPPVSSSGTDSSKLAESSVSVP